jgi:hypothetical protein
MSRPGRPPPPNGCRRRGRSSLSAFLRPFNVLGWAALAIGELQLAG